MTFMPKINKKCHFLLAFLLMCAQKWKYIKTNLLTLSTGADPGFDQGGGAPDRDRPKTAILGPQFCRILVLGPHF